MDNVRVVVDAVRLLRDALRNLVNLCIAFVEWTVAFTYSSWALKRYKLYIIEMWWSARRLSFDPPADLTDLSGLRGRP